LYLYLLAKTVNTPDTPYRIAINDITDANAGTVLGQNKGITFDILQYQYNEENPAKCRYVYIDISGNNITALPANAFGSNNITGIKLPNSITSIGSYAFSSCDSLTSITIPNGVLTIGMMAFDNCSGLTSVIIPNSVTSIGMFAFYKCTSLTSVTIPTSVTSIASSTFDNCSGLTSVTIPAGVTSIGNTAFADCTSLTSVTFERADTTFNTTSSNYSFITQADSSSLQTAYTAGGAGTYTRPDTTSTTWTKQP